MFVLKEIISQDFNITKLQANIQNLVNQLNSTLLAQGAFVTTTLSTSDTKVNHTLGRPFQGWIIVDRNANQTVYQSDTTNNLKDLYIILKASGAVTVKIYFF